MGYSNHFTGAITITPPLTRKQINEARPENFKDIRLRIVEREIESDDGETVTVRTTADAIIPLDMEYSGYNLEEEIQSIVNAFGEHEFAGFIEVRWDAGFGEPPSRFIVKGGRVVQIDAQYRWPGEWGNENGQDALLADARALAKALFDRMRDFVPDDDVFGEGLSWETLPDWMTGDGLGRALWAHGAGGNDD